MFFRRSERQFDQTVRAYNTDLYRYAYWLCRDRFVAEDLVQQTFERAWKNWQGLQHIDCVKSWLITFLRREHAHLYQRKRLDMVDGDPETLVLTSSVQFDAQLDRFSKRKYPNDLPRISPRKTGRSAPAQRRTDTV